MKNSGNNGSDYTATWIGPVTPGKAIVKEVDEKQDEEDGNGGSDYTATWIGPDTPGKAIVKEVDEKQGKDDGNDWTDIPNTAKGEINETKSESNVIDINNKNISNFLERKFEHKVIAANEDYNEDSDEQDSNGMKESTDYKKRLP